MKQVFFTINVTTGKSVRSISELKESIKALRKELESTKDPDKYAKIETQLKGANRELKDFNKFLQEGKSFTERITGSITDGFKGVGASIIGAFAVEKVLEFGAESIKAFQDAQLNAVKLHTAVGVNGGLQEDFEMLIAQSEKLQNRTIFSDDAIQQAQTAALQFGLSADQVKKLIPIITDFASATGQDLNTAMDSVLRGINGNAKGLKIYGLSLEEGKSKTENLASITDQLNTKFKGQSDIIANTSSGSVLLLKNKFEDLQESIGGFSEGFAEATSAIGAFILNGFKPLDDGLDNTSDKLFKTNEELKKFQTLMENANIINLQNQIDKLNAAGVSTDELTKRLNKLKQAQLEGEIKGLDDKALIKLKNELEGLKKSNSITFSFNVENEPKLKAIDEELKRRHLEEIAQVQDLTHLTINELNKRKDELKKVNSVGADDAISAIDKEIKRREDASKKIRELREKELKSSLEAIQADTTATKQGSIDRLQAELDALIKEQAAKEKSINEDPSLSPTEKLNKVALLYDEIGKKIELKEKEINEKKIQNIKDYNLQAEAITQQGSTERVQVELDGLERLRIATENNSSLNPAEKIKQQEDLQSKINAKRQEAYKIEAEIDKQKLERRKLDITYELSLVAKGTERERELKAELARNEADLAKNAVDARLNYLTYELQVGVGLNNQEYQEYLTLLQRKEQADKDYNLTKKQSDAKNAEDLKAAYTELEQGIANFYSGLVQLSAESARQQSEEQITAIQNRLNSELDALDVAEQKALGTYHEKTAIEKYYDRERAKLRDKAAADEKKIKRRQFDDDKNAQALQAVISTAAAVVKALPNYYLAAAVAATGLLEIGIIENQVNPYEQGGLLIQGRSHAEGGVPAIVGGQTPITLEGEEIILNKNVSRNPRLKQIASELNSTTGGVAFAPQSNYLSQLIPSFSSPSYTYPTRYVYDSGGVLPNQSNVNVSNNVDFSELKSFLNEKLSQPVKAYVLETEITNAQTLNRTIERRATFN